MMKRALVRAPRAASATGLFFACSRCRLRLPSGGSCPRCGQGPIADLRDPDQAEHVLIVAERWRALPPAARVALALCAGVAVVAAAAPALATPMAWVAVYALSFALHGYGLDPRPVRVSLRPYAALELPPSSAAQTIRGHIHVRRSIVSPCGATCAAWQVRGRGERGRLDDAGVGAFDLYDGGRLVGQVESAGAFVQAGRLRRLGRTPLAEGLLLEGDLVEVCGPATPTVVALGPRESAEIAVFSSWPLVRKISPASGPR